MSGSDKFSAPPVIETALSVQFAPLPGYTAAHAGWFWKEYVEKLGDGPPKDWKKVVEATRLPDVFEKFGAEDIWLPPSLKVTHGIVSPRVQIIRGDGERMIQVQDTRFVLNWRKQASPYPSYDSLLPEFRDMLRAFESFCSEASFGQPAYNQWEVNYVNHIKKGDLWNSARNLNRVFPAVTAPLASARHIASTEDDTISADWRYSLIDNRGRMHIQFRQSRVPPTNTEVIQVTNTARGPVDVTQSWEQGMNFGHEALRETFMTITSSEAQAAWKKGE